MPERVTTGSEPTVAEVVAAVFDLLPAFMSPRPSKEYTTRMVEERFGAVEPGHDEQAERLNTGEAGDIADEFMAAQQAWQPDPRTVAAVVQVLLDNPKGRNRVLTVGQAVDHITERLNPSKGTDGR
jgi:hypothetical protein